VLGSGFRFWSRKKKAEKQDWQLQRSHETDQKRTTENLLQTLGESL
jgi:hypothetical protein